MTVHFDCPRCGQLIAFDSKHAGKTAHCSKCGQKFIIPNKSDVVPQTIKEKPEAPETEPGFYRAVFIDNLKLFCDRRNATGLVFIAAAVGFKFFLAHLDFSFIAAGKFAVNLPIGSVIFACAWGSLLWYYTETICATAFGEDVLPDVGMDGMFGFISRVVGSIYKFFIALIIVLLPCVIAMRLTHSTPQDMHWCAYILAVVGICLFPSAILIIAVGNDLTMLRPDYLLAPLLRTLGPYLITAAIFFAVCQLELWTPNYGDLSDPGYLNTTTHLAANIAVQYLALIAIRTIGLYHRHYYQFLPW